MKNFLIVLVVVVVLGGAYYLWQSSSVVPSDAVGINPESGMPAQDSSARGDSEVVAIDTMGKDVKKGDSMAGPEDSGMSEEPAMITRVTFDGSSFSPKEITIKKGGTVTWTNASSKQMWVASAVHPSHEAYAGTSRQEHCPDTSNEAFDQCAGGGTYSFTFENAGTWGYHDHLTPSATGKVVVE